MEKHEIKVCPRCGAQFQCKANRVERCDCLAVSLSAEALEWLSERYEDCLCVTCLAEINRLCIDKANS
jgi:hypothetical protein